MAYYLKTTGNTLHKLIYVGARCYKLTSDGDLFIADSGRQLKKHKMTSGYYFYRLKYPDGIYRNVSAHRLVAKFFVDNPCPLSFDMVNHIDGNKLNNDYKNLEWCDKSHNMKHAYRNGLIKNKFKMFGSDNPESVRVGRFDKDGVLIKEYACISDAAKELGEWRQNISQACRGIRKTVKGSIWKYL